MKISSRPNSSSIPWSTLPKSLITSQSNSSPHELTYGTIPDYWKLIQLFAVGHTKVDTTATALHNSKYESQNVPMILMHNGNQCDGCILYNPSTKSSITSSDYRLDLSCSSGPLFNLPHEESMSLRFTLYDPTQSTPLNLPAFSLGDEVFITSLPSNSVPVQHVTILSVPLFDDLPHTVQLQDGPIREYVSSLSLHNPQEGTTSSSQHSSLRSAIPWVQQGGRKINVFLTNKMTTLNQGYLTKSNTI
jgi:hypothetical protein